MAGGGGDDDRSLKQTPTWAVAVVCLGFVVISLLLEHGIHRVSNWLSRRNKKALYEALEKLKAELMLLGFISLLLTVGQKPISMICISKKLAGTMLPCEENDSGDIKVEGEERSRKILWESMSSEQEVPWRRVLAAAESSEHCSSAHGQYPLVSQSVMNQLHIFIFLLAVLHVLYSVLTVLLARAKMRRWKVWEIESQTLDYQFSNDPARFRLTHETSFVKRHMTSSSRMPILKWIVCFFRQFFWSVTKVDYLTLRYGFIVAHLTPDSKFDFHKYIKRSLDDDFKRVVGISPSLWAFAVIFLLLNVSKWYAYFWLSFVPLAILLLVGTKLQSIITEMALEIQERHVIVQGTPIVQPTNELFWFGRPQLVLFLIHFTLFQNAFQLAFFFWIWYEYGLNSCFHERFAFIIARVVIGVAVQFLCSYITLPLYALVTQMGSHMKKAIFEEQTANALQRWHQKAKKKTKRHRKSERSTPGFKSRSALSSGFQSGETTPIHGSSPLHLLRRFKTEGDIETAEISERYYHSEYDASDTEIDASTSSPPQHNQPVLITKAQEDTHATKPHTTSKYGGTNSDSFSFVRL